VASLEGIIFDVDGTVADTERDGHRVAFNKVFAARGLGIEWDVEGYGELLAVPGGKERMRHEFPNYAFATSIPDLDAFVEEVHREKTETYIGIVEQGGVPLRPGIERVVRQAHDAGVRLAVASTSASRSVTAVLETGLGDEICSWFDVVLAGDDVSRKKPDPEIYFTAIDRLGLPADNLLVVEDSRSGLVAAKSAGLKCVVTYNYYTEDQDFSAAELVVTEFGTDDHEGNVIRSSKVAGLDSADRIDLAHLQMLFA